MNFDDSVMGLFMLLCIAGTAQAFIYYINKLKTVNQALELARERNDALEAVLAKILHYFDEDNVASHKYIPEKTNCLVDARIALTGNTKSTLVDLRVDYEKAKSN